MDNQVSDRFDGERKLVRRAPLGAPLAVLSLLSLLSLSSVVGAKDRAPWAVMPLPVPEESVQVAPLVWEETNVPTLPEAGLPGFERGRASWYGRRFAGRRTACGTRFDPGAASLAHPSLPCGTRVRITNPRNGREVVAVVNDRGPYTGGRIADLSQAVARALRFGDRGTLEIEINVLSAMR